MPFKHLKGKKLMLVNILYQKGNKLTEYIDYLNVIYKDLTTGEKHLYTIEEPTIDIYEVKEEFRDFKYPRHFLELDKLNKHTVKYRNVMFEIAKLAGKEEFERFKQQGYSERRQIFKYPYVLGGDIDVETYYRLKWFEQCDNNEAKPLTKLFLDIETDQIDWDAGICLTGECEINMVTIVDDCTNTSYTFLYDNGKNPQIKPFIDDIDGVIQELHDLMDETYGVLNYKLFMFTDEIEMLKQIFLLINTLKRDMLLIWNMGFDANYIMRRLEYLDVNPRDIMCHPDFKVQTLYYREDTNSFTFANKGDYFDISQYTVWIDQMLYYAASRKSQGTIKSVKLNDVGKSEIQDEKIDYSEGGSNIRTIAYDNYRLATIYNIKDVILQMGIERKVHDMDGLYLSVYNNCVPYKKATKQTVALRSFMYKEFLTKKNLILGHNVNFDSRAKSLVNEDGEEEEQEGFEGALNADPMLNDKTGLELYKGVKSQFLFKDVVDFDATSYYPFSIITTNNSAHSLIGKLIIHNCEEILSYSDDAGKEFLEDFQMNDPIFTGTKWFGLPSAQAIIDDIDNI